MMKLLLLQDGSPSTPTSSDKEDEEDEEDEENEDDEEDTKGGDDESSPAARWIPVYSIIL